MLFILNGWPVFSPGFCRLIPHPRSPGTWTIYFEGADYESHLTRENTELASIVTVTDGQGEEAGALRFENIFFLFSGLVYIVLSVNKWYF